MKLDLKHISRQYLYAVLIAAVSLSVLFGAPLSHEQIGGIDTFLAVLLGADAAYQDPRVGRKS